MKISYNWISEFLTIEKSPEEISDKLTSLGLEASYYSIGKSFSGVVLGKIVDCCPHDNADKLSVCEVDIGDDKIHTIVCGAPNVKSDIYVPVAKVGSTLNNGEFEIKKAKLRGIESNGMICSAKELQINDDHSGIMILNSNEKLGSPIEDILRFNDDVIFEIDLTPNRGDCLSHFGVARELAIAYEKNVLKRDLKQKNKNKTISNKLKINIIASQACRRYATQIIKGVRVAPSPQWLKDRLSSIGIPSINNIVDAANYVLMDSGQPMHTFDLGKVSNEEINVRFANKGEKFTSLDNVKRTLDDFHLLICDSKKPIAIAGIMGGVNSEITDKTTDILIESAYFNPTVIRKGAKKLDLSTEASRRFERDIDIDGVVPAINQLTKLITELSKDIEVSELVDCYSDQKNRKIINFSVKKCNDVIGIKISDKQVEKIFKSLKIEYVHKGDDFRCKIPLYRNDLDREIDLVEEVARIIGYDNIPASAQFTSSYKCFVKDDYELDSLIKLQLKAIGFHEHYSNSLQQKKFTQHYSKSIPVKIKNPLSQDMEYLRNSIIPGLLLAAAYNENRQEKSFKLFEIGMIHNISKKTNTGSNEKKVLGLLLYGDTQLHWRNFENRDVFRFKGEIAHLLNSIGIKNIFFKVENEIGFDDSIKIYSKNTQIGILGLVSKKLLKDYDINIAPIVCQLSLNILSDLFYKQKIKYKAFPQFPSMVRDISLQVNKDVMSDNLINCIWDNSSKNLIDVKLFDVYESKEVGNNKKSLAFSLKFQSEITTLTDKVIDNDLVAILDSLKRLYGATQR